MEQENVQEEDDVSVGKRKSDKSSWKRTKSKIARLSGKEFVDSKGNTIAAKSTGPNCR